MERDISLIRPYLDKEARGSLVSRSVNAEVFFSDLGKGFVFLRFA